MIQQVKVIINKKSFKNTFSIFSYILYNIFIKTINAGTILLIMLFEFVQITISHEITLFIPLLLLIFYLLIALEETYHIVMLISLGKQDFITHIAITKIHLGFISFIGGVCVCYTGSLKKSDMFYISLAGPIMPLFYLFTLEILFVVIGICIPIDVSIILELLFFSTCAPLSALIPIKSENYISDGYRIINFICANKISWKKTIVALIYTIKSMIYYTFVTKGI